MGRVLNLKWLPIGFGVAFSICLLSILPIELYKQLDYERHFPYVSESGGSPPASGLFTIFIALAGCHGIPIAFVVYIIAENNFTERNSHFSFVNICTLISGLFAMSGLIIAAAHPIYDVQNGYSHAAGAMLTILFFPMYCYGQFWISSKQHSTAKYKNIIKLRLWLTHSFTISLILMIFFTASGLESWSSAPDHKWMIARGKRSVMMNLGAISEWIAVIALTAYKTAFVVEFSEYTIAVKFDASLSNLNKKEAKEN